jgi:hypothetical protein
MKLSTMAQCQWQTTARIGGDPATENEGKRVRAVGHLQGLLGEEVEGGDSSQTSEFGQRRQGHCSPKMGKSGKSMNSWSLSEGEADGEQEGVCLLPPCSERVGMWRGGLPSGAQHGGTGERALGWLELKLREGRVGGGGGEKWGPARGAWWSCGRGR